MYVQTLEYLAAISSNHFGNLIQVRIVHPRRAMYLKNNIFWVYKTIPVYTDITFSPPMNTSPTDSGL